MTGERKWQLTDIAISLDHKIVSKEIEKVNKYIDLARVFIKQNIMLKQKLFRL